MQTVYKSPRATFYLGDALQVMRELPSGEVAAVLTDPPYSSGARRENARSMRKTMLRSMEDEQWIRGDALGTQGFLWLMREAGLQWRRLLIPGGHALTFTDWRMSPNLAAALETADLRQHPTIVWNKTYFGMGAIFRNQYELIVHMSAGSPLAPLRRDVGNLIPCKPVRSGDHPTEKPIDLLETLLTVVCPPGGVVLDPFAGVGTTGEAALRSGRKFVGIEADPAFAEIAAARLAKAEEACAS